MDAARVTPERVMVSAALALTAIVFLPSAADPVNVVKLTILLLAAIGAMVAVAVRAVRARLVSVPTLATAGPALVLAIAFAVAAVVAPVGGVPVLGTYGRNSGLLAYGAALLLYLIVLRAFDRRGLDLITGALVAAGLFTSVYGLFQLAGIDAISWANPFNPVIASLGNPDFASAYMGIVAPASAGVALTTRFPRPWRATAGLTLLLCLIAAAASSAIQGPIAAAAGLAVLALAWTVNQAATRRRNGLLVLGGATGLGLAGLVLGALGHGPAASAFSGISYQARTWYWSAAVTMFKHRPVFGVGLDMYGGYWWRDRPIDAIRVQGGGAFSDAAHSVPLQVLAQGGLVLGLTYLLFVLFVGVRLVQGLRRLQGDERLLLGGVGGAWVAYQVQSVVSIDQVPLIVAHFVLSAGVLVAADSVRLREVRLPGAPQPIAPGKRRNTGRTVKGPRPLTGTDYAWLAGVGVVATILMWESLIPLRADIAARQGSTALAAGDGNRALASYNTATRLTPGVGTYWARKYDLLSAVNQPELALAATLAGARHDPFNLANLRTAATAADGAGRVEDARRLYARAVSLDPNDPQTLTPATAFELRHGGGNRALGWLLPAVARQNDSSALWTAVGDAYAQTGQRDAAVSAYQRALQLEPGQPDAQAGLVAVQGS